MDAGQTKLTLEELDGRVLPGAGSFRVLTGPEQLVTVVSPIAYSPPAYHGFRLLANNPLQVEGAASTTFVKSTASGIYNITGTINLTGFGTLNVSGFIQSVSASQPRVSGQLNFSTSEGTITVGLADLSASKAGAIPSQLIFTVTSATGEYSHAGGEGIMSLTMNSSTSTTGHLHMSLT
jgi:hypothetical protein